MGLKKPTGIEIDENGFQFNRATDDESFAIISWASKNYANHRFAIFRDVAQPGSALAWGARGREFESRHPDQPKSLGVARAFFMRPESDSTQSNQERGA